MSLYEDDWAQSAKPKRDEFEHFVGELLKVSPEGLPGEPHKGEKKSAKAKSAKKAPPKAD